MLHVYNLEGYHETYAPSRAAQSLESAEYCFEDDGSLVDGSIIYASVVGALPSYPWEVPFTTTRIQRRIDHCSQLLL